MTSGRKKNHGVFYFLSFQVVRVGMLPCKVVDRTKQFHLLQGPKLSKLFVRYFFFVVTLPKSGRIQRWRLIRRSTWLRWGVRSALLPTGRRSVVAWRTCWDLLRRCKCVARHLACCSPSRDWPTLLAMSLVQARGPFITKVRSTYWFRSFFVTWQESKPTNTGRKTKGFFPSSFWTEWSVPPLRIVNILTFTDRQSLTRRST